MYKELYLLILYVRYQLNVLGYISVKKLIFNLSTDVRHNGTVCTLLLMGMFGIYSNV